MVFRNEGGGQRPFGSKIVNAIVPKGGSQFTKLDSSPVVFVAAKTIKVKRISYDKHTKVEFARDLNKSCNFCKITCRRKKKRSHLE